MYWYWAKNTFKVSVWSSLFWSWFFNLRTHRLRKKDKNRAYTLLVVGYGTLYLLAVATRRLEAKKQGHQHVLDFRGRAIASKLSGILLSEIPLNLQVRENRIWIVWIAQASWVSLILPIWLTSQSWHIVAVNANQISFRKKLNVKKCIVSFTRTVYCQYSVFIIYLVKLVTGSHLSGE